MEEYGYIGTASVILRTALNTSREPGSDERFETDLTRMVTEIVKVHNGYLERHRSVFTDNYTFKPFLLDSKLRRVEASSSETWYETTQLKTIKMLSTGSISLCLYGT